MLTLLGSLMVIASSIVISAKNPVHSVIALIFVFINGSALMISLGSEFIGILFLMVYVGAIAILFLFIVMMINIQQIERNLLRYVPVGILIGILLWIELTWLVPVTNTVASSSTQLIDWVSLINYTHSITLIGAVLFQASPEYLILASLVLLVAMVGAIHLTLHHRDLIQRQDLYLQIQLASPIRFSPIRLDVRLTN